MCIRDRKWPTPTARDYKGASGSGRQMRKGNPSDTLPNAVKNWPTPDVAQAEKVSNRPNYGQVGLANHPDVHGTTVQRDPMQKDRLRLLGNGVVPQTAAKAYITLSERLK